MALKFIMDFSNFCVSLFYDPLQSAISRHISRHFKWNWNHFCSPLSLGHPWYDCLPTAAATPGRKQDGNSQQQFIVVAWWLWGPMLNYPFAMEVPEVLRCRKKNKTIKVETRTCWVTSWGPNMLGGSHQYFRVAPPWSPKHTFVYRACTQYLFCTHTHILCVCANKIAFATRFVTQHKIQDSKKIMKPPGTLHHFSNFHETTSSPCTFDEATPDRPATDSNKFLWWIDVDRGSQKKIQPWSNNPKASVKNRWNFPFRFRFFCFFLLGDFMTSSSQSSLICFEWILWSVVDLWRHTHHTNTFF